MDPGVDFVGGRAIGGEARIDEPRDEFVNLRIALRGGCERYALRRFKRKVLNEEIIKDIKRHAYYLKPGEKKRVKAALARKRNRKKRSRDTAMEASR